MSSGLSLLWATVWLSLPGWLAGCLLGHVLGAHLGLRLGSDAGQAQPLLTWAPKCLVALAALPLCMPAFIAWLCLRLWTQEPVAVLAQRSCGWLLNPQAPTPWVWQQLPALAVLAWLLALAWSGVHMALLTRSLDPRPMWAAASLGANGWQRWWRVVWPSTRLPFAWSCLWAALMSGSQVWLCLNLLARSAPGCAASALGGDGDGPGWGSAAALLAAGMASLQLLPGWLATMPPQAAAARNRPVSAHGQGPGEPPTMTG